MKSFTQLFEELTFSQKKDVDMHVKGSPTPSMYEHLPEELQHEDTIIHPFNHHMDNVTIPKIVSDHLNAHGYSIASPKDYLGGYAVSHKDARQIGIGKVLSKSKAPQEVVQAFVNDDNRKLAKKSNLAIAYTRSPYHVDGMQTDRGWSSCMDLNGGINAHYVPDEIKAGTHVAYLIHKNDKNIESPIARIALKPFKSKSQDHMILRPEKMQYGSGNSQFEHAVNSFAETHFPAHPNELYTKHPGVYDDSNGYSKTYTHHSNEVVDEAIRNKKTHGIDSKQVIEGIKRLPEGSAERKEANEDFVFHNDATGALAHVAKEIVHGNADAGALQNTSGDFDYIHPDVANKLVEHGHYKKIGKYNTENLISHPGMSDENRDKLFDHTFDNPEDIKLPKNAGPRASAKVLKIVEQGVKTGSARTMQQVSHIKSLAESKHISPLKLKNVFAKTFDELPQTAASTFTSDFIGRLKKNPNYTMEHAKAFDRSLKSLGHQIGDSHALFATTHPDATVSDYQKYQKTNPGDHFTKVENVSRIIRKHAPDRIFEHEYKNHPDPVHFASINDSLATSRQTQVKHEIQAINKGFSAHKQVEAIEHIDPENPHNPAVKELMWRRLHDVASDTHAVRGNLIPIMTKAIKNKDVDLADRALRSLSSDYHVEAKHIAAFKDAFPHRADDIDNQIQEGDIKVKP